MRLILAAALAGLLLLPASASAAKRYSGCVAESRGCQHRFVGGDAPGAVQGPPGAPAPPTASACATRFAACCAPPPRAAGSGTRGGTWNIGAVGKHIARWYVNGFQVARWKFRVVPEGD